MKPFWRILRNVVLPSLAVIASPFLLLGLYFIPAFWWPPTVTQDDPRAELALYVKEGTVGPLYVATGDQCWTTIPFEADTLPFDADNLRFATLPEIRNVIHGRLTGKLGPMYNASTWIEIEVRGTEIAIAVDYDHNNYSSIGLISRYRLEGGTPRFLQRTHLDRTSAWYRERQPDSLPVIGAILVLGGALIAWWRRHKPRSEGPPNGLWANGRPGLEP